MVSTSGSHGTQAIARTLTLLEAIVTDGGQTSLSSLAAEQGLAPSTARRYAGILQERGLTVRVSKGRYAGSARLRRLLDQINPLAPLIATARPILARLPSRQATAHLGTFDGEMVTYLVREGSRSIFTREHAQLEAYCTGIGKALLSLLPASELQAYLEMPMVKITPTTIIEKEAMTQELAVIRQRGYAIDNGEMQSGLVCIAVPLGWIENKPCAISLSFGNRSIEDLEIGAIAGRLTLAAAQITECHTIKPTGDQTSSASSKAFSSSPSTTSTSASSRGA